MEKHSMNIEWIVAKWIVDFDDGTIRSRKVFSSTHHPDNRLMKVLEVLVHNAGTTVSTEQILQQAWKGRVVSADSVSTAIYQLRKLLHDNSNSPQHILTIPHEGYRLVAEVNQRSSKLLFRPLFAGVATVLVIFLLAAGIFLHPHIAPGQNTIYIPKMIDSTGDPGMRDISIAVDATLISALIRSNPDFVTTRSLETNPRLRLESEIVACDLGPALVVRLIDTNDQRFLWSEYYDFYGEFEEPTLVEHVARRVTQVLSKT